MSCIKSFFSRKKYSYTVNSEYMGRSANDSYRSSTGLDMSPEAIPGRLEKDEKPAINGHIEAAPPPQIITNGNVEKGSPPGVRRGSGGGTPEKKAARGTVLSLHEDEVCHSEDDELSQDVAPPAEVPAVTLTAPTPDTTPGPDPTEGTHDSVSEGRTTPEPDTPASTETPRSESPSPAPQADHPPTPTSDEEDEIRPQVEAVVQAEVPTITQETEAGRSDNDEDEVKNPEEEERRDIEEDGDVKDDDDEEEGRDRVEDISAITHIPPTPTISVSGPRSTQHTHDPLTESQVVEISVLNSTTQSPPPPPPEIREEGEYPRGDSPLPPPPPPALSPEGESSQTPDAPPVPPLFIPPPESTPRDSLRSDFAESPAGTWDARLNSDVRAEIEAAVKDRQERMDSDNEATMTFNNDSDADNNDDVNGVATVTVTNDVIDDTKRDEPAESVVTTTTTTTVTSTKVTVGGSDGMETPPEIAEALARDNSGINGEIEISADNVAYVDPTVG